jgi:hypothetical protein
LRDVLIPTSCFVILEESSAWKNKNKKETYAQANNLKAINVVSDVHDLVAGT